MSALGTPDAARRARAAYPEHRADLDSLPRALRACADEVERDGLPMLSRVEARGVAACLRALSVEVASVQEREGERWEKCDRAGHRSTPTWAIGFVCAHRVAPCEYSAKWLRDYADIPAPADPWAGWTRTSATDAAKAGVK